jgi:FtsZ-binding cell division protein ZapB
MSTSDKLQQISAKVELLLRDLERLQKDNRQLSIENRELRSTYDKLEKEFGALRLKHTDQSSAVRVKLQTILGRLAELESTG